MSTNDTQAVVERLNAIPGVESWKSATSSDVFFQTTDESSIGSVFKTIREAGAERRNVGRTGDDRHLSGWLDL